jgi:uncharacterized protein YxjI
MLLERRSFLVKEQVAMLKVTDRYDIYDPETGNQIGVAQEQIGGFAKFLRIFLMKYKSMFPTTVVVMDEGASEPVITIKRRFAVMRSHVDVIDHNQTQVGFFKSKLFTLGGGFTVHSPSGEQIADVKGNWKGWDFQLLDMNGNELGRVNKKWAGAMTEIFTSADNYVISLNDSIGTNQGLAALLLAASLAIDIVFKENG